MSEPKHGPSVLNGTEISIFSVGEVAVLDELPMDVDIWTRLVGHIC